MLLCSPTVDKKSKIIKHNKKTETKDLSASDKQLREMAVYRELGIEELLFLRFVFDVLYSFTKC